MWWSDPGSVTRRTALLGLAVALAGCGFRPVYGPGGAAAPLLGQVSVEVPATEEGYRFRQRLLERLGRSDEPRLHLAVDLAIDDSGVAITEEQETTRYNLPGAARFTLTDRATGTPVQEGEVDTFSSYSATGTAVSTFAAEADARQRLAVALADLVMSQLIAGAVAR